MKENRNKGLVFIPFIFAPFLSLPFLYSQCAKRNIYALYALGAFMALLSTYYLPIGDQYRWLQNLNEFRLCSLKDAFDLSDIWAIRDLNIISLFVFFASKVGLTLEVVRFLIVLSSYLIMTHLFVTIVENSKKNISKITYVRSFLIIFFSVPLFLISYGFRTGFAASIFSVGLYYLFNNREKKAIVFLLLASLTHVIFLLNMFVALLCRYIKVRFRLILLLLFVFVSLSLVPFILNNLSGQIAFLDVVLDSYILSDSATEYGWDRDGLITLMCYWGCSVIAFYYFLFTRRKYDMYENYFLINLFLLLSFSPYYTFVQRICASIIPCFSIYFVCRIIEGDLQPIKNIFLTKIILFLLFFNTITPIYRMRDKYIEASLINIVWKPAPLILLNDFSYMGSRVDDEGTL